MYRSNSLIVPAREKSSSDVERLIGIAADRLPLDELVCERELRTQQPGTDINDLGLVYSAPAGKLMRVRGLLSEQSLSQGLNPCIDERDEFFATSLVYAIQGVARGGFAHRQNIEHEPPTGWEFAGARSASRERHRPAVRVEFLGSPIVRHTVELADESQPFIAGKSKYWFTNSEDTVDVTFPIATADIEDVTVDLVDDCFGAKLAESDFSDREFWHSMLWTPPDTIPARSQTAESYAERAMAEDPELSSEWTIDELKEFFWHKMRYTRGRALADDPYPEAARLRLATAIDNDGNNAHIFAGYGERYSTSSDIVQFELPDGSVYPMRRFTRDELLRRLAVQAACERTGYQVLGGRQ